MKILNLIGKIPVTNESYLDICEIVLHKGFSILLRLLAPITPHITHELWTSLGFPGIVLEAEWPKPSPIVFKMETVELVVQVNGKLRSRIRVPSNAEQHVIEATVKDDAKVQQAVLGKSIRKIITVPGKLVNVVTEE